ncbi:cytosine methyltransferase [Ureaplasma diversum]|uniref:DNA (cytosine-5-)-methyltransferase n=1 Tax=Ureaplasma diversum TaxID=42094 RepID=A0A0C5RCA8_9BACT|nr:DNA cytosine methyltransferase [Ureaplasma diversum]AJQ45546.1 cytosine methyltransferase [Ureaplasma diversum]
MKNKKIVDLFAGAGGLTMGFVQNGFEIVDTIEFWNDAVQTYNHNFKTTIVPKDITSTPIREELETKHANKVGLVIGGFPCQGYSIAGKRSLDDERNQLYIYTIDVIKRLHPDVCVLENVKGILSFKEKDNELVVDKMIKKMNEIGYYTRCILVDSSKFGVAQKRERVIFIASPINKKDKVDEVIKKIGSVNLPTVSTKDAISHLEQTKENKAINHIFTNHSESMISKMSTLKEGESLYKNYSDAFRRIYYDKPSPTIKENHGGVHIHPKLNRVLTPKEMALLQSFPDDFIFLGTKSSILKQIGNAVPVKLSYEIAKIIKETYK